MRSIRNQPFCWQEKKILRLLRKQYSKTELVKLRCLYGTITEMDSDFNGKEIKFYTRSIHTYSGLSKDWIPRGLKILQELNILLIKEERINGKFKGKSLVFTPNNIGEIPRKTVTGKSINGETFNGKYDTSEHSTSLEDSFLSEKSNGKKLFLDFVKLKSEEYEKIRKRYGTVNTDEYIERVNSYIGSKGIKYKSHYHTILSWMRKDKVQEVGF